MGTANLAVVYNFDTDTWADFKLFGMLGLTFLFIIAQGFYLMKYIEEPK
jgi:intracellular septation protein